MERYSGDGRPENYLELARDVLNTHPDLILAVGGHLALDFKKAMTTIPIVTIIIGPVALGLVNGIARPGGNVTGVPVARGLEIIGKRMGLLSKRYQNCPPSVTWHRDHSGQMQEVRRCARPPSG